MKTHITLLAGACALATISSASAASVLVIGIHDFTTSDTSNQTAGSGTNYLATGFDGFYNPSTGIFKNTSGGSIDQTYGNITTGLNTPGTNDGYVRTYTGYHPFLQLQNNTGATVALDQLVYDAASSPATNLVISYRYGTSGGFTTLVTTPLVAAYGSFSQDISSLSLTNGQIIQFQFDGGPGGQLDNFGVTAVPEPNGAVIATSLLGALAFFRRRA